MAAHRQIVIGAAALLVALNTLLRAWALFPSFFYADDYRLLSEARHATVTLGYLGHPFEQQLMPLGRALASLVGGTGLPDWGLAAGLTVGLALVASASCAWMLFTLFGVRALTLVPLAVYLLSAVPVPMTMRWAAALQGLPLQAVLFLAVGAWVRWLRSEQQRWLVLTGVVLGLGLLSTNRTLLVFLVLAYCLLAFFNAGGLRERVRSAAGRAGPALVGLGVAVGYGVYYYSAVPDAFVGIDAGSLGRLARTQLGVSAPVGLVGGPWSWDTLTPPAGLADPPHWATALTWTALLTLAVVFARRRRRTGRVWGLLIGYAAADLVLLATSPAQAFDAIAGYDYLYLADLAPVATLCLGLLSMPLLGAIEPSEVRTDVPGPSVHPGRHGHGFGPPAVAAMAALALVCVGGLVSTLRYQRPWRADNPGADYAHTAVQGLRGRGVITLADQIVPGNVVPPLLFPYNTTSRLLRLLVDNARFPVTASRLVVLDGAGDPRIATIDAAAHSPTGPDGGCGWRVSTGPTRIQLKGHARDAMWWVRIGYLSTRDDVLRIQAGATTVEAPVQQGVNEIYALVNGAVAQVTLHTIDGTATVCVSAVEVGQPVPGGLL